MLTTTLINKLESRNVPLCVIHVIVNWYGKLRSAVRWNGILSNDYSSVWSATRWSLITDIV